MTWAMSAITILTMWMAGNKDPRAWMVGLGNQVLWAWFIVSTKNWGLAPMCLALTFTYGRNLWKWTRNRSKDIPASTDVDSKRVESEEGPKQVVRPSTWKAWAMTPKQAEDYRRIQERLSLNAAKHAGQAERNR